MFAKSIVTKVNDVFRDEYSLAFDGSNDYVEISDVPSFSYNVHSISAWVKPTVIVGGSTVFDYRDANNDGIYLYLADGDVVYQIDNTDGHYDTVLTLNQWHHIVATNDGSTSTIYVNGVSVETADTSGETINVSGSAVQRIGARSHTSPDNYFNGNISEVALYSSALTANQVKTIYNGREPYNHKEGVASNYLQAWYRMGDGAFDSYIGSYNGLIGNELNTTLASNLVTNGTFDADSNWTKGSGWSIGSGVATASDASGIFEQDISAVTGKIYKVSLNITSYTTGFLFIDIGNQSLSSVAIHTGLHELYITATGDTLKFYPLGIGGNYITASIDNVKVQEVGGNVGIMTNMGITDIEGDTP